MIDAVTWQSVEIELRRSPDKPSEREPDFQTELTTFGCLLREVGITYSQRAITFDAVDAVGHPLAEFLIQQLGPAAITGVAGVIGAWVHARAGRRVRLKIGDKEAEADTVEKVEQLLRAGFDRQGGAGKPNQDK